MCSIYNYIHLHIHKCIHIELPCLFVVVFAQQNKLSKNCRKGHLIRIFWTAASRFLSAPHPLLRRLVNACGLVFCRWTSSEFSFWKKKGTKKGQCLFFAGGKRKKRARRRERILEVQVSEVETCCVQVESRKKMTLTFLQKKKAFKIRTVWESVVPFDPPEQTPFVLARKWAFWKSAWLLATLKDLGEIKNHVGSFFRGPHGFFGNSNFWAPTFAKKTHNNNKKRAGHPSFWRFHWEDRSNKLFACSEEFLRMRNN